LTDPAVTVAPISAELGLADVFLRVAAGTTSSATVVLDPLDAEGKPVRASMRRVVSGQKSGAGSAIETWTARIMSEPSPTKAGPGMRLKVEVTSPDHPSPTTIGPIIVATRPDPALASPDWAKGAVWYQIFPERFRNGNPANDPATCDTFPRRWNSDWSAVSPAEMEAARARAAAGPRGPGPASRIDPRTPGGALFQVATARRYGGDLQGVVQKLDDLKDLGVTAIYLCPIFQARSMHKYDATDYRHIDQTLGDPGSPPAEFVAPPGETDDPATWGWTPADRYFIDVLLPEAKRRGIRVIIDGVWNHVGTDFWAFQDVVRRGLESPYHDWFNAQFDREPGPNYGRLIGWKAWNGPNGSLPELRHTPDGDLAEPVKQHIFAVTRRWMDPDGDGDPSDGVDGWRLDVAPDIGPKFWSDWRALVKSINPDAFLAGEVWFKGTAFFGGRAFDAQMNYPFAKAAVAWIGTQPDFTTPQLTAALDDTFDQPPQTNLVQMNLLGSHDTERLVSMLANPGRAYSADAKIQSGAKGYNRSRPGPEVYQRALLGVALQATYPGAPMVYAGEEWGVHGANDPDNRKPVPWPDLEPSENSDDAPVPAIREQYRTWFLTRTDPDLGPLLRFGAVAHLETGDPAVFAFERTLNEQRAVVILNRSDAIFDAKELLGPLGGPAIVPALADTRIPPRTAAIWSSGAGVGRAVAPR
jgi:cyclomaltodextrinase